MITTAWCVPFPPSVAGHMRTDGAVKTWAGEVAWLEVQHCCFQRLEIASNLSQRYSTTSPGQLVAPALALLERLQCTQSRHKTSRPSEPKSGAAVQCRAEQCSAGPRALHPLQPGVDAVTTAAMDHDISCSRVEQDTGWELPAYASCRRVVSTGSRPDLRPRIITGNNRLWSRPWSYLKSPMRTVMVC
jgi:hypothetical protein